LKSIDFDICFVINPYKIYQLDIVIDDLLIDANHVLNYVKQIK